MSFRERRPSCSEVLLNSAVMMPLGMHCGLFCCPRVELELEGRAIGRDLGLADAEGPGLQAIDGTFQVFHHTFVFLFLSELILRTLVSVLRHGDVRTAIRGLEFFKDIVWLGRALYDFILPAPRTPPGTGSTSSW